jgi:hypothetical protein
LGDLALFDTAAVLRGSDPQLLGQIPAHQFPRELIIAPGGQTALVTNFGSGQLQAVALGRLP